MKTTDISYVLVEQRFGPPLLKEEFSGGHVEKITRVGMEDKRDELEPAPGHEVQWAEFKKNP
jgi:hypothetical protein